MKKITLLFSFTMLLSLCSMATSIDTLYWEDFTNTANDNKGLIGPIPTNTAGATPTYDTVGVADVWMVNAHGATGFVNGTSDYFKQVSADKFAAIDVLKGNPYVSWLSRVTDISAVDKAKVKVNFEFNGSGFVSAYFLKAYYVINGGTDTVEFKSVTGDQVVTKPESFVAEIGQLSGSTLQVIIRIATAGTRYISILDVLIGKDEAPAVDVVSVSLDQQNIELETNQSMQLEATIAPEDASNNLVSWKSLDEAVATVENGLVSALSVGTTKIVVTSNANTGISDTCAIEVIQNDTIYWEDFSNSSNNGKGVKGDGNAGTYDLVYDQPADASWTVDATGAEMELATDYFIQHSSQTLLARNINGNPDAMWISRDIDISMFNKVKVSVDMIFACKYDETEYANAYYIVDGGTDTILFGNIMGQGEEGSNAYQPKDTTVAAMWVEGESIKVIIKCNNNSSTDYTKFDNVMVSNDITNPPTALEQNSVNNTIIGTQRDLLYIKSDKPQNLKVYSIAGIMIQSKQIQSGENYIALPSGMYLVMLQSPEGKTTQKVLIK